MTITERIDAITKISPEYLCGAPPAPKSLKIELTARCNFMCAFCARSARLRTQKDMDFDLFRRLAVEMRGEGVEELGLFYLGESFMLPWLENAIAYAKGIAEFPYVFLTTNGSLAKPERLRTCFANGLDSLKFSLNYADEAQFKEIAQVKGSLFENMQENIRAAREVRDDVFRATGHRCGLYGSYIMYDGEQGAKMADMVEALSPYLDEIYELPLYNQADLVTEEEASRGWEASAGNRGRSGALRDPLPCWAVFTEGHITYDGKLSACCFDHTGDFDLGDLTEVGFLEAWQSEKFQALRAEHIKKNVQGTVCEGCVVG